MDMPQNPDMLVSFPRRVLPIARKRAIADILVSFSQEGFASCKIGGQEQEEHLALETGCW